MVDRIKSSNLLQVTHTLLQLLELPKKQIEDLLSLIQGQVFIKSP